MRLPVVVLAALGGFILGAALFFRGCEPKPVPFSVQSQSTDTVKVHDTTVVTKFTPLKVDTVTNTVMIEPALQVPGCICYSKRIPFAATFSDSTGSETVSFIWANDLRTALNWVRTRPPVLTQSHSEDKSHKEKKDSIAIVEYKPYLTVLSGASYDVLNRAYNFGASGEIRLGNFIPKVEARYSTNSGLSLSAGFQFVLFEKMEVK